MRITTKELTKIIAEASVLEYIGAKGSEVETTHADLLSVKAGMFKSGAYGTMAEIEADLLSAIQAGEIEPARPSMATEANNAGLWENGLVMSYGDPVLGIVRR